MAESIDTGMVVFGSHRITPEYIEAVTALATGTLPPGAVSRHPGKGGKMFDYVKHTYANKMLRQALGASWSSKVLHLQILPDDSAAAIVELTRLIPIESGNLIEQTVSVVGVAPPTMGNNYAERLAGAESRGLCRAMMRMFGFGAELYDTEEDMSREAIWAALKSFANNQGVKEEEVKQALANQGFSKQNPLTADNFEKAYQIVAVLAGTKKPEAEVPAEFTEAPQVPPSAVAAVSAVQMGKEKNVEVAIDLDPEPAPEWTPTNWGEIVKKMADLTGLAFEKDSKEITKLKGMMKEKFGDYVEAKCAEYWKYLHSRIGEFK